VTYSLIFNMELDAPSLASKKITRSASFAKIRRLSHRFAQFTSNPAVRMRNDEKQRRKKFVPSAKQAMQLS